MGVSSAGDLTITSTNLFLKLEGIEHRTTKVRRPQSMALSSDCTAPCWMNTSVSRGTTWHESVEQMQTNLESYLEHYNIKRPHQGQMMEGQTPYNMLKKGLRLIPKKVCTKVV